MVVAWPFEVQSRSQDTFNVQRCTFTYIPVVRYKWLMSGIPRRESVEAWLLPPTHTLAGTLIPIIQSCQDEFELPGYLRI